AALGMAAMRVLHGIWADDVLCVWAEDSALPASAASAALSASAVSPASAASSASVGEGAGAGAGVHPFACQHAELTDLLEPAGDIVRKAVDHELTLWLPTAGGAPRASAELIRPEAASDRRAAGPA